jgi:hypothetical protein
MEIVMTKVMKAEVCVYYILKVIGYLCGFAGALCVIGFAGGLERELITETQFWLYELNAFGLIGVSYVTYWVRGLIEADVMDMASRLRRKVRRQAPRYI